MPAGRSKSTHPSVGLCSQMARYHCLRQPFPRRASPTASRDGAIVSRTRLESSGSQTPRCSGNSCERDDRSIRPAQTISQNMLANLYVVVVSRWCQVLPASTGFLAKGRRRGRWSGNQEGYASRSLISLPNVIHMLLDQYFRIGYISMRWSDHFGSLNHLFQSHGSYGDRSRPWNVDRIIEEVLLIKEVTAEATSKR